MVTAGPPFCVAVVPYREPFGANASSSSPSTQTVVSNTPSKGTTPSSAPVSGKSTPRRVAAKSPRWPRHQWFCDRRRCHHLRSPPDTVIRTGLWQVHATARRRQVPEVAAPPVVLRSTPVSSSPVSPPTPSSAPVSDKSTPRRVAAKSPRWPRHQWFCDRRRCHHLRSPPRHRRPHRSLTSPRRGASPLEFGVGVFELEQGVFGGHLELDQEFAGDHVTVLLVVW